MQIAESIFEHEEALQTRTQDISLVTCDDQGPWDNGHHIGYPIGYRWGEDIKRHMDMLPLYRMSPEEVILGVPAVSLSSVTLFHSCGMRAKIRYEVATEK